MTGARTAGTTAVALAATLGLAAVSWAATVPLMHGAGMDMGAATGLGPFGCFGALWMLMTAATMLPGAAPAVLQHARADGRVRAAPLFVASYLAVWAAVGVAVHTLYRPHGTVAAGAVAIAAGLYELTPLKRDFRRRCRVGGCSGVGLGLSCVGSCLGLMLIPLALDPMSVGWMSAVAVLVLAQKLLPARAVLDLPTGLAIVGLGVLAIVAPGLVPAI